MSVRIRTFAQVYAIDRHEPPAGTVVEFRSTTLGDKCCQMRVGDHDYLLKREDIQRAMEALDAQEVY